jgi:hypothetical protein
VVSNGAERWRRNAAQSVGSYTDSQIVSVGALLKVKNISTTTPLAFPV